VWWGVVTAWPAAAGEAGPNPALTRNRRCPREKFSGRSRAGLPARRDCSIVTRRRIAGGGARFGRRAWSVNRFGSRTQLRPLLNRDLSYVNVHSTPEKVKRRVVRRAGALLLSVSCLSAVAGVLGVGAAMSDARPAFAASCSGPLGAGEIRVVLVVDASDLGAATSATCLVVPSGTTGSQLLARRGAELGTGAPRYGSSGLLCAIDGRPATGCGDRNSGGFEYWAYFNGTSGSWVYGNYNPFARRLSDGDIEGWRYVSGAGNGQDPPPRIAPSRSLFPALLPSAPPAPAVPELPSMGASPSGSVPGIVGGGSSTGSTLPAIDDETPEPNVGNESSSATTFPPPPDKATVDDVALASAKSTAPSRERWLGFGLVLLVIVVLAGGAWKRTRRVQ